MKKIGLSSRQLKAITCILENNSMEETAKKARVSRSTLYNWFNDNQFKARLEKERESVFEEGLMALKTATSKAAKTLIQLLDSKDRNTRRLAAKEIINVALKVVELQDIQERIEKIEEQLEKSRFLH